MNEFCVGERVIHRRFGSGTLVGEYGFPSIKNPALLVFHLRLDANPPVHYGFGRNPIYALPAQLRAEVDLEFLQQQEEQLDEGLRLPIELQKDSEP